MPELSMKIGDDTPAPMKEPVNMETKVTPEGGVAVTAKTETPAGKETPAGDRPAWLPEKFKTAEDMAKSYTELEKKLGEKTPASAPVELPKGVDIPAVTKEYQDNGGKLSDKTLEDLKSKGISKDIFDAYISGQQAIAREQHNALGEIVGGTDNLGKILSWAKTGLTQGEIKAYNDAVDSGNTEGAKLLLGSISQKYAQANGVDPKLVSGSITRTKSGVEPFKSSAEVVKAMRDPRYQTDAAYQKLVADRLDGTAFFIDGRN